MHFSPLDGVKQSQFQPLDGHLPKNRCPFSIPVRDSLVIREFVTLIHSITST